MNFNWIKTALLAATAMVSLNSFSQDLIARQAPIDRKLKSVDSLALQKQIRAEQSLYPGLDLYPNWNNEFVQAYGNAIVPESYTFDLTGFCMPTPNTRITDVFGYRPRRIRLWRSTCRRSQFLSGFRVIANIDIRSSEIFPGTCLGDSCPGPLPVSVRPLLRNGRSRIAATDRRPCGNSSAGL